MFVQLEQTSFLYNQTVFKNYYPYLHYLILILKQYEKGEKEYEKGVNYGFNNRDEAFVYTENVEEAYEACKEAALEAGYKVTGSERANSITFSKTINGNSYNIFLLKEVDKGYLRVMNDIGGTSFMR